MSNELAVKTATELLDLYRSGKTSPVEAVEAALNQITRLNDRLNAFCLVDAEGSLAAARESEARWRQGSPMGPLDGIPTSIKDLVVTKGWPTLRGSKTIDPDQPWEDDAPAVARLREAGAILLGKTTTPEFGWKGVTDSPLTGITRNPWDPERTPGGSSGGAAAAAATGMGALHIGTDAGGSIRIPAAFTGIYGLKGSFGRVPAWPASPFATLSNLGPMTRSVADAALMFSVISRPDPRDWFALPPEDRDYGAGLEGGVDGWRVAFSAAPDGIDVQPDIAALVAEATTVFESLGARVEEAEPPIAGAGEIFRAHWFGGAAQFLGGLPEADLDMLDPGLRKSIELGQAMSRADYMGALERRRALGFAMHEFMNDYDLLLTPMLPLEAFAAGRNAPRRDSDTKAWVDWTPLSFPFNLSRQPAASVPCGLTETGLPAAIQLVGRLYDDHRVLQASRAFEAARPWTLPPLAMQG